MKERPASTLSLKIEITKPELESLLSGSESLLSGDELAESESNVGAISENTLSDELSLSDIFTTLEKKLQHLKFKYKEHCSARSGKRFYILFNLMRVNFCQNVMRCYLAFI